MNFETEIENNMDVDVVVVVVLVHADVHNAVDVDIGSKFVSWGILEKDDEAQSSFGQDRHATSIRSNTEYE